MCKINPMNTSDYEKWLSQLRKGYLELCVLSMLEKKKSSYGFEILQTFEQAELHINEGTLYPLLNRMHKNGWLNSHWEPPSEGGHPRRFYELSEEGESLLPKMQAAYLSNQKSLAKMMELT